MLKEQGKTSLMLTPCPNFTPTAGHIIVPTSKPSPIGSVIESDVDTNDLIPDKALYKPSSTTEEDTNDLSMVPIQVPIKITYAEVASPKCRGIVASSAKTAHSMQISNFTTKSPFPPLLQTGLGLAFSFKFKQLCKFLKSNSNMTHTHQLLTLYIS